MKFAKIIVIFLLIIFQIPAFSLEEKNILRVGISNNDFSAFEHKKASFILPDGGNLLSMEENKDFNLELPEDATVDFELNNDAFDIKINDILLEEKIKGAIVLTSNGKIGINGLVRKNAPAYYRGMIELKPANKEKFNIINVLDMQTYLKGVVPNEMPVSFGIEALKAQAVAARNYANGKSPYLNYDVCDSVACQVYFGANGETKISNQAVDETQGIYALYNNEIILALYSSTASGITENYLDTFGNGIEDKPYLKSVKDNKSLNLTDNEAKIEDFFENNVPSFDMNSPKHRWQVEFDRHELEETLNNTLIKESKAGNVEPAFDGSIPIEGLQDIRILKRGASYKALEVLIKSKTGAYTVKKELSIRRVFKRNSKALFSANFFVEKVYDKNSEEIKSEEEKPLTKNAEQTPIFSDDENFAPEPKDEFELAQNNIKSIFKKKFKKKLPSSFIFKGAGFGHGVGMSQYGAGYLSSYGVDYENILKHYYSGITLGTMPKTVEYNKIGLDYVQEFYFAKKIKKNKNALNPAKSPLKKELTELIDKNKKPKCYLNINNPNKAANAEFYINEYYFNPNIKSQSKKTIVSDITEYLNDGYNKIIFKPLKENEKKKKIIFNVTIGN